MESFKRTRKSVFRIILGSVWATEIFLGPLERSFQATSSVATKTTVPSFKRSKYGSKDSSFEPNNKALLTFHWWAFPPVLRGYKHFPAMAHLRKMFYFVNVFQFATIPSHSKLNCQLALIKNDASCQSSSVRAGSQIN